MIIYICKQNSTKRLLRCSNYHYISFQLVNLCDNILHFIEVHFLLCEKGSFLREHRDDHNQLDLTFISLVVRKGADVISLVMYETGKGSQETVSNLLKRDGRTLFLINLFVLINL